MSEWSKVCLGELIKVKHGFAFPGQFITSEMTDRILVTPGNFCIGGGFKQGKFKYFSSHDYPAEYQFLGAELIVTMTDLSKETDTLGYSAVVPSDGKVYLHNQRVGLIEPISDQSCLEFVYWLMRWRDYQVFIVNSASGTSVMHTSPSRICEFEFELPPLPEQKAIASVLSSLDGKIDLLHRQNKTLEAMTETLFRQWFIEDETLTEVVVSELIEFNPKRSLSKGSEAIYLEMAGLSTQSFNATGYYRREFSSGTKFVQQDTLLARITPCLENGKAGYVTFLSDNEVGWGSTEYIVMRPKAGIHPLMAYVLCRNQDFKDYAESCMEGSSGRQRVNVDHLKEFTIGKPSDEVIQQFNDYLESIESKLIYNSKQIQTLENLRDTLLPKLMSGEVRVQYQTEDVA